jgi:hypothetical protein
MTDTDPLELGRRLRALRVDPPDDGFEAKLAERLLAVAPEPVVLAEGPAGDGRRPARVIIGPWRRGPVRLIGATALLVAGAAAALEGGVVEWLETRVLFTPVQTAPPASVPSRAVPERTVRAPEPRVEPRQQAPAEPVLEAPRPTPAADVAAAPPAVPRLTPERHERPRPEKARSPEPPPAGHSVAVPRVQIEPRALGRADLPEARINRAPGAAAAAAARERAPGLERIRDIARARRERAAVNDERTRPIERLRERRERAAAERREMQFDRGRREQQPR